MTTRFKTYKYATEPMACDRYDHVSWIELPGNIELGFLRLIKVRAVCLISFLS